MVVTSSDLPTAVKSAQSRSLRRGGLAILSLWLGLVWWTSEAPAVAPEGPKVVVLVVDGLRPDYVTEDLMPRLHGLAEAGVRGAAHHAVFPTETRVNGPSIFTGRYPTGHGQMGNSVYLPEVAADRVLDAGKAEDLRLVDARTGGSLLTAASLAELLAAQGKVYFAASSGSTGSALLMNHRGAGAGLVHHAFTVPDSLGRIVTEALGPPPTLAAGDSGVRLVARAVDALLRVGLDRADADVLAAWLTEPDGTAHARGIGAPETLDVLRVVDSEIGRLVDGLQERGLGSSTNVLVTSDHGFASRTGSTSLHQLLVEGGLKASGSSLDVVLAGGAIHVREGGSERIEAIVRLLQSTEWIGPVFTRAASGGDLGSVPGTASFASVGGIRLDQPLAGTFDVYGNAEKGGGPQCRNDQQVGASPVRGHPDLCQLVERRQRVSAIPDRYPSPGSRATEAPALGTSMPRSSPPVPPSSEGSSPRFPAGTSISRRPPCFWSGRVCRPASTDACCRRPSSAVRGLEMST